MNTILVTGANRGLGLEIVKQYYEGGWRVFACCRAPSEAVPLQALASSSADRIKIFSLDVKDIASIRSLVDQIGDSPIDILMNNAGVFGPKEITFRTITPVVSQWLEVLQINTIAPLLLAENLINNVARSQLKIIANMSSKMGSIADNTSGTAYIYRSSKAALNAAAKSLAIDLREYGIVAIVLHPGWVKTDMGGPNALITVT
ncbi:MAG: SDR family oxidoreductase, partial [Gammaproteobacteria bacterium]